MSLPIATHMSASWLLERSSGFPLKIASRANVSSVRCSGRGVQTNGPDVLSDVRPSGPAGGPIRVRPLDAVLLERLCVIEEVVVDDDSPECVSAKRVAPTTAAMASGDADRGST